MSWLFLGEERSEDRDLFETSTAVGRFASIWLNSVARSTLGQQGFLDSLLFFTLLKRERDYQPGIRVASEVCACSRAIIDDELWTAGFQLCWHVFGWSEEINPLCPALRRLLGRTKEEYFFWVLGVVIFNNSKLATPGASKISKCLPRLL